MASSPRDAKLQDVRALATKLYGQCRDSPGSYKLLAGSVRKLRNVLEDVEDILDETRTLGPDDLKLLERVARSSLTLHQLDLALQSYRCSKHINVSESAIADFKTVLDVTAHEVELAFEAITTGEIELRLDTSILASINGEFRTPVSGQPSSSNLTDSADDRKSSTASSAWSLVPRDSPSLGSASETPSVYSGDRTTRSPSDDKEVYDFERVYLPTPPSPKSTTGKRPSLDWRSPFASPDPLSLSFEEAQSMILADDDAFTFALPRSRSATGSTAVADARTIVGTPRNSATMESTLVANDEEVKPLCRDDEMALKSLNTLAKLPDAHDSASTLVAMESGELLAPDGIGEPRSDESLPTSPTGSSPRSQSIAYLSPKSAAEGFYQRSRNNSIDSISSQTKATAEGTERSAEDINNQQHAPNLEREDSALASAIMSPEDPIVHQAQDGDHGELRQELNTVIETAFGDVDVQGQDKVLPLPPPPLPARPPPIPPKPRRATNPVRVSTYRIVNASPPDSPSSEDELYMSSKPSSPAIATQALRFRSRSVEIPLVKIDTSACDEEDEVALDAGEPRGLSTITDVLVPSNENVATESRRLPLESNELLQADGKAVHAANDTQQSDEARLSQDPLGSSAEDSMLESSLQESAKSHEVVTDSTVLPPTVPERPAKSRYHNFIRKQLSRPTLIATRTRAASTTQVTGSSTFEKEIASEAGLEVHNKLNVNTKVNSVRQRISFDAALNVRPPSALTPLTGSPQDATRHSRSASTSQVEQARRADPTFTEFYAPGGESTRIPELERERVNHIVHFWNNCAWNQAEAYLMDYLTMLVENDNLARARRVRHLLGVCASFKGEWRRAIPLFLSAMRTPMRDIAEVDDGDCAAAYWLGDSYSLLNQRTEALFAYCVAERSSLFHDPAEPLLNACISIEQEAVQLGAPKDHFKLRWAQESFSSTASIGESILDTNVITTGAAKMLLDNEPRRSRRVLATGDSQFQLSQHRSRSNALFCLHNLPQFDRFHRMKLNASHFDPDTEWPMMYDPLFAMANVQRGRLLLYECDLLDVFNTNSNAKIPKSGPMGLSRMDCFTCLDLIWLIKTIRECLCMLEMEFSEVSNIEGTWFVVRYSFLQNRIATTHYFSIALFKQTFRAGYGADICPDGIYSARIIRTDYDHNKGVHLAETKRITKLIREFLDEAAKGRRKLNLKNPSAAANAEDFAPPLPPRPKT